jgi:hypothetical protein
MTEAYPAFPKIARLKRSVVITEKIDGTNALIHIAEDGTIRAGSRTRWITPESDNFGFARWVSEHAAELALLGPGHHYGEWWGQGIQRRYGLEEKRFSLFNVSRWADGRAPRPACCGVVPTLYQGVDMGGAVEDCLARLRVAGSVAAPGWMSPEGIVVFHSGSSTLYKVTLDNDGVPKGVVQSPPVLDADGRVRSEGP